MPHEILKGKTIFLMFYAKSLRTRNSFETGIFQLGGHANFLTTDAVYEPAVEGKEQAYVTERLDDVANVLSRYGEAICIRILGGSVDWEYGAAHKYMRAFAKAASVPVINMEDDLYHPCQGMADLMTMDEKLGTLEGKKIVMSWAYSPSRKKPVAVPHSMMAVSSLFGAHVVFARPKGFELDPEQIEHFKDNVARYGGSFTETDDMKEAFKDADVVYPEVLAVHRVPRPSGSKPADWDAQDKLFDANKELDRRREDHEAHEPRLPLHALPAVRPRLRGHRRRRRRAALSDLRPGREPDARAERRHVDHHERLTRREGLHDHRPAATQSRPAGQLAKGRRGSLGAAVMGRVV